MNNTVYILNSSLEANNAITHACICISMLIRSFPSPAGYDGGDCCRCDCVDGDFACDDYDNYRCIDPSSSCVDDDDYDDDNNGDDDNDDDSVLDECLGEAFGCLFDASCIECLESVSNDTSLACATTAPLTTCAYAADLYCCMLSPAGDGCSDNVALVSYLGEWLQ